MRKSRFALLLAAAMLAFGVSLPAVSPPTAPAKPPARKGPPNIILILADDLGYGELGCYGQTKIETPNLDRLAAEGVRFTQFYAGSTVCAPSRSVLMTGQHVGHTRVRGNAGANNPEAQMLKDEDVTVAEVLKKAGYATGLIGKWGLGLPGDEGVPNKQGFDYFFGYLSQHHAHNHYPDYLWRNDQKVSLPNGVVPVGDFGGGYATNRVVYAGDLLAQEARDFVARHRERPFFLFWSMITPHANNERTKALGMGAEVPDLGQYADRPWTDVHKAHAAMITRLDEDVGRLMTLLRQLDLDRQTIVFFSSDNGPHRESGNDPEFFRASGPLRGIKRDLTDGGIRVPFIARWPGKIPIGIESEHVGYFGDFMATAADLSGGRAPRKIDSLSLLPALLGKEGRQRRHPYLYWEFHERGSSQAVLLDGEWKGIRPGHRDAPVQLFNLKKDLAEQKDVAAAHPGVVAKIERLLRAGRTENPHWPLKDATATPGKTGGAAPKTPPSRP